jgi:hypothetical protein
MFRNRSASDSLFSFRSIGLLSAASAGLLAGVVACSGDDGTAPPGQFGTGGYPGVGGNVQPGSGGGTVQPGSGGGQAGTGGSTFAGACPSELLKPCKACHDGRGTAATPMGLLNFEDFHAPSHSQPAKQVYEILSARLHSTSPTPMPPDGTLDAGKLASIDAWTAAGAPDCSGFTHSNPQPGTGGGSGSGGTTGQGGTTGSGGTGSGGAPPNTGGKDPGYDITPYLSPDGQYFIKDPPGTIPVGPDVKSADMCFNIVAHNAQTPVAGDPSKFSVPASEFYHAFQFKVPYDKPAWALSTRPIIDNNKVIHHWLLFQMAGGGADGSHANEVGLQVGNAMLTGWAPGGNPLDMPAGVGLEMPPPNTGFLSMENHYNNATGSPQPDRSGVRICVTFTPPKNPASLTWLGTELINIPANGTGTATGTCTSWKKNVEVHMLQSVPHMHTLGSHMKTVINRAAGGTDILIDKPFVFTDQRAYAIEDVLVKPNDTLTTTCTWQNTTSKSVAFGTATSAEMCYNFVVYYPAHVLDGIKGIEGSNNMCLF